MFKHVVVVGTFDGFHDGHRAYIDEAYRLGTRVSAIITPDTVVKKLKKYSPRYTEEKRSHFLKNEYTMINVTLGDTSIDTWKVLEKLKPDVILLGYDQNKVFYSLKKSTYLVRTSIPIIQAQAYEPKIYHNRLLHNQ